MFVIRIWKTKKKILEVFLGSVQVPVKESNWSILSSFPFFSFLLVSDRNSIQSPETCYLHLSVNSDFWPNLYGYLASMKPTVCLWKYAFWKLIVFIPHLFSGANLLLVYKSLGISEDFIPHREFKFTIGKNWCKNPWHFTFHLLDSQNAGGIPSIEYPQMPKDPVLKG